jgi:hypothetical protein
MASRSRKMWWTVKISFTHGPRPPRSRKKSRSGGVASCVMEEVGEPLKTEGALERRKRKGYPRHPRSASRVKEVKGKVSQNARKESPALRTLRQEGVEGDPWRRSIASRLGETDDTRVVGGAPWKRRREAAGEKPRPDEPENAVEGRRPIATQSRPRNCITIQERP